MTPEPSNVWRKVGAIFALTAEVLEVRGNVVHVRFTASKARCVLPLDPLTGGPKGYERVKVSTTATGLCDCTGVPHRWERGCPAQEAKR